MTIASILPFVPPRAVPVSAASSVAKGGTGDFLRAYDDSALEDGTVVTDVAPSAARETGAVEAKSETDGDAAMPEGWTVVPSQMAQAAVARPAPDGDGSGPAAPSGEAEGDLSLRPAVKLPPADSAGASRAEHFLPVLPIPPDDGLELSANGDAADLNEAMAAPTALAPQPAVPEVTGMFGRRPQPSSIGASLAGGTGRPDGPTTESMKDAVAAAPDSDLIGAQASASQALDPSRSAVAAPQTSIPAMVDPDAPARFEQNGMLPIQTAAEPLEGIALADSARSTDLPVATSVAGPSPAVPAPPRTGPREAEWFGRLALAEGAVSSASDAAPETSPASPPPGLGQQPSAGGDRMPAGPPASPLGQAPSASDPDMGATGQAAFHALQAAVEQPALAAAVTQKAPATEPSPQALSAQTMRLSATTDQAASSSRMPGPLSGSASGTQSPLDASFQSETNAAAVMQSFNPEAPLPATPSTGTQPSPASGLRDIALQIVQASAVTDRQVEIVLAPQELGRLQIAFATEGDVLRVMVSADRPETLDLLRRNADHLMQELRDAGITGASLSFAQSDHRSQSGRPLPDATGGMGTVASGAPPADRMPDPPRAPRLASATLDLRL